MPSGAPTAAAKAAKTAAASRLCATSLAFHAPGATTKRAGVHRKKESGSDRAPGATDERENDDDETSRRTPESSNPDPRDEPRRGWASSPPHPRPPLNARRGLACRSHFPPPPLNARRGWSFITPSTPRTVDVVRDDFRQLVAGLVAHAARRPRVEQRLGCAGCGRGRCQHRKGGEAHDDGADDVRREVGK